MHIHDIAEFITAQIAPDVSPEEISADYDLIEGGILDSLAMVRLVAWLGDKFDLPVNEIDINPGELLTLEGIDKFIQSHSGNRMKVAF